MLKHRVEWKNKPSEGSETDVLHLGDVGHLNQINQYKFSN